ncbi:selenium-binding protein SBP56-related protein [Sorangium sp. So ce136]|uniref:selenium-binding protein SBP56-related protein n=1 Tax=Sorangium sp. So ce136 TaxID=3133284 RepID=UPI003F1119B1
MKKASVFKSLSALGLAAASVVCMPSSASATQDTLLVWASDAKHRAPDFLTVVDFDAGSPTYGKVLKTVPLPFSLPTAIPLSTGAIGNEPHHVGVSADGKTLAAGGLLSILRVQNQNFVFDIQNPRSPKFVKANTLPLTASIADEYVPLSRGGFLTTFMGGVAGEAPGRVVEYDGAYNEVGQWPLVPPLDDFNPHGIAIDEAHNLLLTSDFVCPLHTLDVPTGSRVEFRGAVRVWDLASRTITKKIPVGDPSVPAGTINVELIPGDPELRAYVTGVNDGRLYLVKPLAGTAPLAIDFNYLATAAAPKPWPHLFKINRAGTRLALTLNFQGKDGKVVLLNIENREHPTVLSVANLGPNSGPHYLAFSPDEDKVVVADYFLVQDLFPTGVVQVDGDRKIRVFKTAGDVLTPDTAFDLDFNRDIGTGPARPHGIAIVRR